jgi:hypothetical protein
MISKLKELFKCMNEQGIPLPLLRDHGKPSVSLTLLWISSVFVILGLLSLSIKELQVNVWEALAWHVTSAVLYYNRGAKIGKDGIEITSNDNQQE